MLNNLKNELVITLKLIIVFIIKMQKRGIVNFGLCFFIKDIQLHYQINIVNIINQFSHRR